MQGSCNCNRVQFSFSGDISAIVNCHCKLCRKMNGSAFSTYVVVPDKGFVLTQGDVTTVKVAKYASKSFCHHCGTPIFNQNPKLEGLTILYLGAIDDLPNITPAINIFCESQLDWVNQLSSLTCFEQGISTSHKKSTSHSKSEVT